MAAYNNSSTGGTACTYYPDALDGATKDGAGRGAADLYDPDARAAAPAKNTEPYMSSFVSTATESKDGAAARNEDVTVHIDDDTPAGAKNRHGEAAKRGKGNVHVHFLDIPHVPGFAAGRGEMLIYPSQTTAAAVERKAGAYYYNSGVVVGEALPLATKVSVGKTTTIPAEAVGHDKVAGAFTERLRRELPVLGLSVASLAVAGLAAGEPTPAAGFGLFLMLIVGLSTVTIHALRD